MTGNSEVQLLDDQMLEMRINTHKKGSKGWWNTLKIIGKAGVRWINEHGDDVTHMVNVLTGQPEE